MDELSSRSQTFRLTFHLYLFYVEALCLCIIMLGHQVNVFLEPLTSPIDWQSNVSVGFRHVRRR